MWNTNVAVLYIIVEKERESDQHNPSEPSNLLCLYWKCSDVLFVI